MLCCSAQHGALRERLLHLLFKGRKRPGSVFRFPPVVSCLLDDKAPRHGRRAINDPNESSDSSSPCPHVARTADRPRNVAASACGERVRRGACCAHAGSCLCPSAGRRECVRRGNTDQGEQRGSDRHGQHYGAVESVHRRGTRWPALTAHANAP